MAAAADPRGRKRPLQTMQQARPVRLHPSRGGRGYSEAFREQAIVQSDAGVPSHLIDACERPIQRWRARQAQLGTCRAYEQQGNHEMLRFRSGDLALLIHCRLTFPKSHADEVRAAYIANYSPQQSIYSRQDIHDMEERLEMPRKGGSSRALQSLLPLNKMCCRHFWSEPPPVGWHGLDRNLLIDVDEVVVVGGGSLNSRVRSYGKARRGQRVVEAGTYTRTRPLAPWRAFFLLCELRQLRAAFGRETLHRKAADGSSQGPVLHRIHARMQLVRRWLRPLVPQLLLDACELCCCAERRPAVWSLAKLSTSSCEASSAGPPPPPSKRPSMTSLSWVSLTHHSLAPAPLCALRAPCALLLAILRLA